VRSIRVRTPEGDNVGLAVASRGEYGVPENLQFGYPVRSEGTTWSVAEGFVLDDFARDRIRVTTEELLAERDEVKELLG
jgi:malate dehydrogenase